MGCLLLSNPAPSGDHVRSSPQRRIRVAVNQFGILPYYCGIAARHLVVYDGYPPRDRDIQPSSGRWPEAVATSTPVRFFIATASANTPRVSSPDFCVASGV